VIEQEERIMYPVIALSPAVDVSTVVGPSRTEGKALEISNDLELLGYTEVCPCMRLEDVEASPPWDRPES
jgi:hypothetical protein